MVGDKLKELRTQKGYTIAQLCEKLKMNPNTYAKYERSERDVSTETLAKIADFYNVTADRILGREKPPETNYDVKLESSLKKTYLSLPRETRAQILQAMLDAVIGYQQESGHAPDVEDIQEIVQTIMIDYHQNPASAGSGDYLTDEVCTRIAVAATPEAEAADCVIRVSGSSMEPTFSNGDLVLVRYQPDIEVGQIGIFIRDGEGYIKEAGEDRLISHNPDYPDIYCDGTQITCIGVVLGKAEQVEGAGNKGE
jgi:transcriptional regulator with XRE-family HTH domain